MSDVTLADLSVEPYFDLEDFMNFSKETRLDSATLENLLQYWEQWSGKLRAVQIASAGKSWLAAWLPDETGTEVEQAWTRLPSQGFMLNNLAQYLCMAAVRELVPQVEEMGCAPTPKPDASLREGLGKLGLVSPDGALTNRYAVVTWHPFAGGCEICALSGDCPKQRHEDAFSGIVLPGYER